MDDGVGVCMCAGLERYHGALSQPLVPLITTFDPFFFMYVVMVWYSTINFFRVDLIIFYSRHWIVK